MRRISLADVAPHDLVLAEVTVMRTRAIDNEGPLWTRWFVWFRLQTLYLLCRAEGIEGEIDENTGDT